MPLSSRSAAWDSGCSVNEASSASSSVASRTSSSTSRVSSISSSRGQPRERQHHPHCFYHMNTLGCPAPTRSAPSRKLRPLPSPVLIEKDYTDLASFQPPSPALSPSLLSPVLVCQGRQPSAEEEEAQGGEEDLLFPSPPAPEPPPEESSECLVEFPSTHSCVVYSPQEQRVETLISSGPGSSAPLDSTSMQQQRPPPNQLSGSQLEPCPKASLSAAIPYPQDYTAYAVLLVLLAPPCGVAALLCSLQMRRFFRLSQFVQAERKSRAAFHAVLAGAVCIILMLIAVTAFIFLHTSVPGTQGPAKPPITRPADQASFNHLMGDRSTVRPHDLAGQSGNGLLGIRS